MAGPGPCTQACAGSKPRRRAGQLPCVLPLRVPPRRVLNCRRSSLATLCPFAYQSVVMPTSQIALQVGLGTDLSRCRSRVWIRQADTRAELLGEPVLAQGERNPSLAHSGADIFVDSTCASWRD
jgi:hypothetical protein